MNISMFNWVISAVTFGPLLVGVPVLVLLIMMDEFVFGPRRRWR